jgi:hypothetical protein
MCFGQREKLQLSYNCLTNKPGFTKVDVIDKRLNNQTLGFIQLGALNRVIPLEFPGSLTDSIAKYFLEEDINKQRELTILLYELYVSERTDGLTETGRLKLSMRLFAKEYQEKYTEILSVDSIYMITSSMDVTKRLLTSISTHLCEISSIAKEIDSIENQNAIYYSMEELQTLDSLEKLQIPMYNATNYNSGIFMNYEQFKNNTPDSSMIIIDTRESKKIKVFKYTNGKKKKLDCKTVYAVSDGNTLLKATSIGFYKLQKVDNDFYYTGQTSFSNANSVAMYGLAFGLVGVAIASNVHKPGNELYRFRINYLKGNSIPLSKAEK